MKIEPKDINEKYLIVLKKKENSVYIDYIEIFNPLRSILDKIYNLCDDSLSSVQIINKLLKDNERELLPLFSHLNYCHHLSSPYQGIESSNFEILFETENIKQEELTTEQKNELIKEKKQQIKQKFKYRDFPYAIQNTYKTCREDNNILAHSHRSVGWAMRPYKLVNDFSIQFKSNFGYGSVSYFYSILTYKEIDIIPFSEWVIYQNAKLYEIIRYSLKHTVRNDSWYEAMSYAETAINLFNKSEVEFVKKYLIDECKIMVDGLENILNNHIFSFKQFNGTYENYEYEDKRLLLRFRGEKISGALKFINNITEYEGIIEVDTFIKKIITFNEKINPLIISELNSIQNELERNKKKLPIAKYNYENSKNNFERFERAKKRITNIINNNEKEIENKTNIEKCFDEKFPTYKYIKNGYMKYKDKYNRLSKLIRELESLEVDFEEQIQNFNDFKSETTLNKR